MSSFVCVSVCVCCRLETRQSCEKAIAQLNGTAISGKWSGHTLVTLRCPSISAVSAALPQATVCISIRISTDALTQPVHALYIVPHAS